MAGTVLWFSFNRVAVAEDGIEDFTLARFGLGATAYIVGDFCFGLLLRLGEGEFDGGALDGDEAPTPGESDVLGGGGEGFDAAAHEFAVAFVPWDITLGRKKNAIEFGCGAIENAALVAFESENVVGSVVLGDEAGGFLLAMHGVGGKESYRRLLGFSFPMLMPKEMENV